jgi:hypothetical protein
MDVSHADTSDPRARPLRDEPQSVRYPTREYQQRQPSLERGVADQTDLKNDEHEKSVLIGELTKALRRDGFAHLTEDSHINDRASAAAAHDPIGRHRL